MIDLCTVIGSLGNLAWREAHPGEWGSLDCRLIRVGDVQVTWGDATGAHPASQSVMFAKFGIYFRFPHYKDRGQG